ncbi:kinase-like protein [Schizopora paradoxa]|uniref:Kinase-like protein n=1 Tax=Schizopora paradoxa TaxID=27342 RepID=A0A0H2S2L1_9AGAM|nr:kinase-like protein [Schizopora paradoxa]
MICPWYANGSLTSFLSRYKSLVYKERLRLIREIASGLYYLHYNSIIHGDLSGANVLINDDQQALLYDFGTSKLVRDLGLTATLTSIAYSPRWAAPEIFESDSFSNITLFGDIYSFGSVAFQVFSGKIPYAYIELERNVLLHRIRERKPPRKTSNIKAEHWEALLKCWEHNPHARPSGESLMKFFVED